MCPRISTRGSYNGGRKQGRGPEKKECLQRTYQQNWKEWKRREGAAVGTRERRQQRNHSKRGRSIQKGIVLPLFFSGLPHLFFLPIPVTEKDHEEGRRNRGALRFIFHLIASLSSRVCRPALVLFGAHLRTYEARSSSQRRLHSCFSLRVCVCVWMLVIPFHSSVPILRPFLSLHGLALARHPLPPFVGCDGAIDIPQQPWWVGGC